MTDNNEKHWALQAVDKILIAILLLVGIVGVTASKGMTVLVVLGGLAGLAAYWGNRNRYLHVPKFFLLSLVLLFIWAIMSSFWSPDENGAIYLCFRLGGLSFAGFFFLSISKHLVLQKTDVLQSTIMSGFVIGLIALSFGYIFATLKGYSLWGHYYSDPLTTLNNGAVILSLLLIPTVLIAWQRYNPMKAISLFILVSGGFLFLSSGASLLSIGIGSIVFILVYYVGKKAGFIIAFVGIVFILTAPFLVERVTQLPITKELTEIAPASAKHRLQMWEFVSNKISQSPYWGLGMDSSRHISQDEFRLAPNMEIMPLHPHDSALQVRLELGLPGIMISAVLVFSLFLLALKPEFSRTQLALRTSVLCSYLGIGAVSYGVWQSWWTATAWMLAIVVGIASPSTCSEARTQD